MATLSKNITKVIDYSSKKTPARYHIPTMMAKKTVGEINYVNEKMATISDMKKHNLILMISRII